MGDLMLRDRTHAGQMLADRLERMPITDPVVLALPRGGVPVAYEIATRLSAPLDLILVKKIGVPWQPELAIGAVVEGGGSDVILNEEIAPAIDLPPAELKSIISNKKREIGELSERYRHRRAPVETQGRDAIVVDDGVATGASLKAALRGLRNRKPERILLAVPVAPRSSLAELEPLVDEAVCLETPEPFRAVGLHYVRFDQVSDEVVVALLDKARPPPPE